MPRCHLAARLTEDPGAKRLDEARLLREGDERPGREQSALGMLPPHECLDRDDLAAPELDDRLVVDDELRALDRSLEVGLKAKTAEGVGVHVGMEDLVAALVRALRA